MKFLVDLDLNEEIICIFKQYPKLGVAAACYRIIDGKCCFFKKKTFIEKYNNNPEKFFLDNMYEIEE